MFRLNKTMAVLVAGTAIMTQSCKKDVKTGILNTGEFSETSAALKDATDVQVGVAVSYNGMINDPKYAEVVKRDFDAVTFENNMKHNAIVQNDGSLNFTQADALLAAVGSMEVFGHTLAWHSQQNASYLKNFAGITLPAAVELIPSNAGFESGLTGWSTFNAQNGATVTATTVASEIRTGTGAMKVVNPVANANGQWRVQVASPTMTTVPGRQYVASYWVKAATAGGSIRISTSDQSGGNAQYQGDQTIGTTFQQVNFTFTANTAQTRFLFDMGLVANTYFIDDASFKEVVQSPTGTQVATKVDQSLNTFITGMVNRYKSKVKAWDVVNELFTEDGAIRNNANTSTTPADVFVWSEYLGRDFALKAFNYAAAADPTATLYINDYNLETNNRKLDSLIKFVAELKTRGAKVDGIGTQMHIGRSNISYSGIDNMMKKLAATGLKVRISELDVKAVQGSAAGTLSPLLSGYQASIYEYVISSYIRHVPPAQRGGITFWGVADKNSWLYNNGAEFPLLYDNNYNKKPAYAAVLKGFKAQ